MERTQRHAALRRRTYDVRHRAVQCPNKPLKALSGGAAFLRTTHTGSLIHLSHT